MMRWGTYVSERTTKELPKYWKEDLLYILRIESRCGKNIVPTKNELKNMNSLHKYYCWIEPLIGQTWADRPERYETSV